MRMEIGLPREVARGAPVSMELRLTNAGTHAREVVLQGRPTAFDLTVSCQDGVEVWRRLEGEVVSAILQLRVLAPGEALELSHTWDQRGADGAPVPPGDYLVRGEIPSDPPTAFRAGPVPLRIRP